MESDSPAPALVWCSSSFNEVSTLYWRDIHHALQTFGTLIAQELAETRGQRIALLGAPSPLLVQLLWACLTEKIPFLPLNQRLTEADWKTHITIGNSTVLLSDHPASPVLAVRQYSFDELAQKSSLLIDRNESRAIRSVADEACLIFTSGSEGSPKGVSLSHEAISCAASSSNAYTGFGRGKFWLCPLPLYHVGGLSILVRALVSGGAVVLPPSAKALDILATISATKVTHLSLVPSMLTDLLAIDGAASHLAALDCILLGGSAIPLPLLQRSFDLGIPVAVTYGMTETSSHITVGMVNDAKVRAGSAGVPIAGTAVRRNSVTGRIEVRSKQLFSGYLNDDGRVVKRNEEWWTTQDSGVIDADESVFIHGRADSVIISGGEKIVPSKIEDAARAFPGVHDACVVAVSHKKWGERPLLYIEIAEGSGFCQDTFTSHLVESLPKLYIPDQVVVMKAFPRIGLGKVNSAELKQAAQLLKEKGSFFKGPE